MVYGIFIHFCWRRFLPKGSAYLNIRVGLRRETLNARGKTAAVVYVTMCSKTHCADGPAFCLPRTRCFQNRLAVFLREVGVCAHRAVGEIHFHHFTLPA
jgi:hypothetical protein